MNAHLAKPLDIDKVISTVAGLARKQTSQPVEKGLLIEKL